LLSLVCELRLLSDMSTTDNKPSLNNNPPKKQYLSTMKSSEWINNTPTTTFCEQCDVRERLCGDVRQWNDEKMIVMVLC
jgi:hypothetical protein